MPVRTRATAATTTISTSTRATVSSPPAASTPPPTIAATRTTESTSTNAKTSTSRKSPAKRTPPALVEQAAPLVPRKRSSGGPTTSAAVRGAVSTKTPPHTTQEKKATTKVGQDSSASPRMSPVPLVAPIYNLVPQGRDPGPGFPPLTPSPRREKRRAEKTPAASTEETDKGPQGQPGQQQGPSGGAEEEGAAAGRTPSPATTMVTAITDTTTTTTPMMQETAQEEDWRVVGRGRKRACASPSNENNTMRSPGGPLSPSIGCGRTDSTGGIFNNNLFSNNNNIFLNLNRDDDGGLTNSCGDNNNNLASAAPSGAPFPAAGTSRRIRAGARSRRAANEGERANGRVNPRGSRAQLARGPTEAQLAVITALETAASDEDLEQSAAHVADNSSSSGGGSTSRAEGMRPRVVSVVNLGPKTVRIAGKGVTRKLTVPTTQTKLNMKTMPVRPRAITTKTTTSSGATVSSPPAVSSPPPTTTAIGTTASTSTSVRTSTSKKSPARRTPPALVGQ
ncbi:hypothetical protein KPH14_000735, partial [Odynerus spinipes]